MTVIAELNQTIQILETTIPANPNSPANLRKRRSLEKELNSYFDKLEKGFPYHLLGRLYGKYAEKGESGE